MALIILTPSTLADAEVVNSNFDYLDNRITAVNNSISTHDSTFSSSITNLSSSLNTTQTNLTNLTTSFNTLSASLTENTWVTTTFNTTSGNWSREFFSDKNKTNRIWLEQGGRYDTESTQSADVDNLKLALPKRFSNTKYYFSRTVNLVANQDIAARFLNTYNDKTVEYIEGEQFDIVTLDVTRYAYSHGFDWYACGI